ncbi:hypothetical protein BKA83DRAFT_4558367 [Pisolithus microcarpus]|nr:hypothetical protein BKA83DRAFT_4558367 [Pisolithus microcarpus]
MGVHAALQFLHSVDWVHRVISSGNVLHSSEMSKLVDPEYAKHMDSNTTHEVRTTQSPQRRPQLVPFKFNPLHDMESLWWIATWTLHYHVDQEGSQPSSEQITQFHELFPRRLDSASHFYAFHTALDYEVLPASVQLARYEVEFMHGVILAAYEESEMTERPDYKNSLEKLNSVFAERPASAATHSRNIKMFSPNANRQQEDPTPNTRDRKQRARFEASAVQWPSTDIVRHVSTYSTTKPGQISYLQHFGAELMGQLIVGLNVLARTLIKRPESESCEGQRGAGDMPGNIQVNSETSSEREYKDA